MAWITDKTAKHQLDKEASQVQKEDLQSLLERQKAIEDKVKNSGKLKR